MEDVLVLILLSVMVTVGMVMVLGGLTMLTISAIRSMRRSKSPGERPGSTGAEADA